MTLERLADWLADPSIFLFSTPARTIVWRDLNLTRS